VLVSGKPTGRIIEVVEVGHTRTMKRWLLICSIAAPPIAGLILYVVGRARLAAAVMVLYLIVVLALERPRRPLIIVDYAVGLGSFTAILISPKTAVLLALVGFGATVVAEIAMRRSKTSI